MVTPTQQAQVTTWQQFTLTIRPNGNLLRRLDEFPKSILITGCQRSGTTMLSRIITKSEGMVNYWFGPDDELDAALILSGYVNHQPRGRYCFQTTYLDHYYQEYYEHSDGHKIIWVLRNPYSVVYSLLYNWPARALDDTFRRCGVPLLTRADKWRYKLFGIGHFSRLRRACLTYNAKTSQLFELRPKLGPDTIMVVDYDDLVLHKETVLPEIYRFVNLHYKKEYADKIHSSSLNKRRRLAEKELATIKSLCEPLYLKAKSFIS